LSGGQQQRVALARGLVAEPELVLFDEPLSNLDARLRDMVRAQLHELHARLRFTAVFVTHDQSEALALGDRLAIMRSGVIEQLDTPENVFEEPSTDYVAGFIGMSNRVLLQRGPDGWMLGDRAVGGSVPIPSGHHEVGVRFRPDDVGLAAGVEAVPAGSLTLAGKVADSQFGGIHMDVIASVGESRLHARVPTTSRADWARHLTQGQPVVVHVATESVIFYDVSGSRIAGRVPSTETV
jgi:iron(III) transport system ATP-binding protein